jgi:uncharacterized protein (DUF58 family)
MIPRDYAARVRQIEVTTRHLADEMLAGEYRSAFKGRGLDFEELRAYEPGDDLRLIDWNVTARLGTAHVRRYREEREMNIILAIDVSASGDLVSGRQSKRDLAAEVGACLAYSAVHNRDRVGLLLFSDRTERVVRPNRGRDHVLRLIRDILYHEPRSRGTSLRAALEHLHQFQRRRSVVFLISDFIDEGYEKSLAVVARRHDVIPIIVRDGPDEALPAAGRIRLQDAETGEQVELDTGSLAVRERIARAAALRRERQRIAFLRAGCAAIELKTGLDYLGPLRDFMRQRLTDRKCA